VALLLEQAERLTYQDLLELSHGDVFLSPLLLFSRQLLLLLEIKIRPDLLNADSPDHAAVPNMLLEILDLQGVDSPNLTAILAMFLSGCSRLSLRLLFGPLHRLPILTDFKA